VTFETASHADPHRRSNPAFLYDKQEFLVCMCRERRRPWHREDVNGDCHLLLQLQRWGILRYERVKGVLPNSHLYPTVNQDIDIHRVTRDAGGTSRCLSSCFYLCDFSSFPQVLLLPLRSFIYQLVVSAGVVNCCLGLNYFFRITDTLYSPRTRRLAL
jgi:hypothetical protein